MSDETLKIAPEYSWSAEKLRRKADQEWELAGLARQDEDREASKAHTETARRYEQLWREVARG